MDSSDQRSLGILAHNAHQGGGGGGGKKEGKKKELGHQVEC